MYYLAGIKPENESVIKKVAASVRGLGQTLLTWKAWCSAHDINPHITASSGARKGREIWNCGPRAEDPTYIMQQCAVDDLQKLYAALNKDKPSSILMLLKKIDPKSNADDITPHASPTR